MSPEEKWDPDKFYKVSRWGDGYFGINPEGHLVVYPERQSQGPTIDISDVIEEMKSQGVRFPAVIRFHDILRSQVKNLNLAFQQAIKTYDYRGKYTGVFPIKVNQMREVIEEVIDAGAQYNYGLEAGSKAELLAVLAYNKNLQSLTVLNGYKDEEYLKLAMLGTKMGRNCLIVVENYYEVGEIIRISEEMNVTPMIGIRAKLSAKSRGKWAGSSGDRAKFGLTIPEILNAVQQLKEGGMDDCIKLLHFHIGSQISDIRVLKEAIGEAARIYTQLQRLGLNMEYLDVGGGLGIDYDGSRSKNDSSKNYRLSEYAADIIMTVKQICDEAGIEHPNIVSESGRSITAHHSCVVTNVVDIIKPYTEDFNTEPVDGEHNLVCNIRETLQQINSSNFQECYHDARGYREDCTNAFKLGILGIVERAKVETLYWKIIAKVNEISADSDFIPEELQNLDDQQAHQYLCNFSVFQSTADVWAVGQVLPIIPLTRLNEEPQVTCTLADITCDSDGKIGQFISDEGTSGSLKLHKLTEEPYYLGIFLTGAYQDVMGDMHNLFGRLNEVHVICDDDDPADFYIDEIIHGSTSEKVLSTMQYNPEYMAARIKKNIDKQIKAGKLQAREGVKLCDFYEGCLHSYTYLNME